MRTKLKRRKQKRILLTGMQGGVGVTYFSLALANAAVSRERRKTLFLEVGKKGNIASLSSGKTFDECGMAGFIHLGVHYLPDTGGAEAGRILNDPEWDVIVCDATEWDTAQALFPFCTEILVLCNLRPWHYTGFQQRMKELLCGMNEKRVKLYSYRVRKTDERRAREEFGIRVQKTPEIADPFRMTREEAAEVSALIRCY